MTSTPTGSGTDTKDRQGPAAGSRICSECGFMYFSEWGHSRYCSHHPRNGGGDGAE